jgi:hypothetical protein
MTPTGEGSPFQRRLALARLQILRSLCRLVRVVRRLITLHQLLHGLGKADLSLSDSLELGTHELTAARHTLRVRVVDKSAVSTGCFFGIDDIDLLAE